jgi:cytochrome c-type biogenesis protein CcmH/NrfG
VASNPRIDDLRKRLEREPGSRLFAQLAEELRKDGELTDAIRVARAGLQSHPNYPSARMTLGRALFDTKDFGAARVEFEAVLRGAPDNILASRLLGECLEGLGDAGTALLQYRATLRLAPGDRQIEAQIRSLEQRLSAARGAGPPTGSPVPPRSAPAASRSVFGAPGPGGPGIRSAPPIPAPPIPPPPARAAPAAGPSGAAPMVPGLPPLPAVARPVVSVPAAEVHPPAPAPAVAPAVYPPGSRDDGLDFDLPLDAVPTWQRGPGPEAGGATETTSLLDDEAPTLPGAPLTLSRTRPAFRLKPPSAPEPASTPSPVAALPEVPPLPPPPLPVPALLPVEPVRVPDLPPPPAPLADEPRPMVPETPSRPEPALPPPLPTRPVAELRPEPLVLPTEAPRVEVLPVAPVPAMPPPPPPAAEEIALYGDFSAPPEAPPAAPAPEAPALAPALSSFTLAELYFEQGAHGQAIGVLEDLLSGDPTNERARARLIEIKALTRATAVELPGSPPATGPDPRFLRRQAIERSIARLEGLLAAVRRG